MRLIEAIIVNSNGVEIGAVINSDGFRENMTTVDLLELKDIGVCFDNALIGYRGKIKPKVGVRIPKVID